MSKPSDTSPAAPARPELPADTELIEVCVKATKVAQTASRNGKSILGSNFYAEKFSSAHVSATNLLKRIPSALRPEVAQRIETIFSGISQNDRVKELRSLKFFLQTTDTAPPPSEEEGLFPLEILTKTHRPYLIAVGRQMNGAFTSGWFDASAVMMRRLIEIAIIEAFEAKGIAAKIRGGPDNNYFQLTDLVGKTIGENTFNLSRNFKKFLPLLKEIGHLSAHGRFYLAHAKDIEEAKPWCRVVVEELLHHAGLL
jgi:hypothetical protein